MSKVEAVDEVAGALREEVARLVGVEAPALAADRPLIGWGLDSLAAIELCGWVEDRFGVAIDLGDLLAGATLEGLVQAIERQAALRAPPGLAAELPPVSVPEPSAEEEAGAAGETAAPLSPGQRALWLLERVAPGSAAYNLAGAARVRGGLDAAALRRAFAALAARHPALRTCFEERAGEPAGRVLARAAMDFAVVPPAGGRVADLVEELRSAALCPFDLARGPLLRVRVWPLADGDALLLLVIHHLIADFWSLAVLLREVGLLYRGETGGGPARLAPLPLTPGEAVRREKRRLAARAEELWSYWRQALEGGLPVLDLATDRPRPPVQTWGGASRFLRLTAEAAGRAHALAASAGATLHAALLAAFQALLHRYSGQDRVCTGIPTAGRGAPGLEGLVGYFVNPVVVCAELTAATTAETLLARTRDLMLGALAHADFPFPLLVERLQPERDASRPPLFQAMLALQRARRPEDAALAAFALGEDGALAEVGGLHLESVALPERRVPCELVLMLAETGDGLAASLQYNSALFDASTAERLLGHFARLLAGMAANPSAPLAELDLLSAAERRQLAAWSHTPAAPGGAEKTLHGLIGAQAARTPGAVAVQRGGCRLTYAELWRQSGHLAAGLRTLEVGPEDRVALLAGRDPDLVTAMVAVLRTGAAYVPLDPVYPDERIAWLLEDARPRAVLASPRLAARLPAGAPPVVPLLAPAAPAAPAAPELPQPAAADLPESLAYLIYTSGSTGRPKAVALTHGGAVALARWARQVFPAEELAGVLATTSVGFDLSIFELLVPLCWGGRVILAENALQLPDELDVRLLNTVPSALAELLRRRALPSSVRTVNLAGEPLPRQLVDDLYRSGTVRRVFNLYGPSEDTTYSTVALQQPGGPGAPPIGLPLAGGCAYLLPCGGGGASEVPIGARGEIYLGGDGLARGYFGLPGLTAERFVPSPFAGAADEPGARLYRTGDAVRRLPGGALEFLGRLDHQLKIRGFRVELGEVEAALHGLPEVLDAVVVASPAEEDGGRSPRPLRPLRPLRLVGFVTLSAAGAVLDPGWRDALRRLLPEVMVPAVLVPLAALPLTPNGKVDRRALGRLAAQARGETSRWRPPETAEEVALAEIWCAALGLERVGADDDFFALGGHSLLASRVQALAAERLGVDLPLAAFFQAPTVAALARRAATAAATPRAAPPRPLPREGADFPLSFAQERLWFLHRLEPRSAVYHMAAAARLGGPLDVAALRLALAGMARRHEVLRTSFPERQGSPAQRIGALLPALPVICLAALPAARREDLATLLAGEEARRPFDLAAAPPLRAALLRLGEQRHHLLLTLHHIAADEASLAVLVEELAALYAAFSAGRPAPRAAPPLQYADFAVWQRQAAAGGALEERLAWWQRRLAALPALDLPVRHAPHSAAAARSTDGPLGVQDGGARHAGHRRSLPLAAATRLAVEALARREGTTLFVTLLAAFSVLLGRVAGTADLALGCPVSARGRREMEGAVGLYVNTLVLRCDLTGEPSFARLLGRLRAAVAEAHEREVPFELLVRRLRPERSLGRNPLFDAAFTLNRPPRARQVGALSLAPAETFTGTAKFDLTLVAEETAEGLALAFEAAAARWDGAAASRLLGQLATLLAAAASDPGQPIAALPWLSAAERHQVLAEWGGALTPPASPAASPAALRQPSPAPAAVHGLVLEWARRAPAALALAGGGEAITYGELARRAGRLAQRLTALGAGPEEVVAIVLERSPAAVVAALAVLQAGAAYLPLDPAHPAERLAGMLADSGARLLIAGEALAAALPGPIPTLVSAALLEEEAAAETTRPGQSHESHSRAERGDAAMLAYVIYTSGSTGAPKGVGLTHAGLANLVAWHRRIYRVTPEDRAALIAGPGFDAAVWEVWPYLAAGASLHAPPEEARSSPAEILAWLTEQRITIAFLPTLLAEAVLALSRPAGCALRALLTGGDRLHRRPPPGSGWPLENHYGPTECTVVATHEPVPEATGGPGVDTAPPIGRPIDGLWAAVTAADGEPLPAGTAGELRLGGSGLARGYLRRPELTAERFVPDPLGYLRGEPGARAYRTGDRVRWDAGGRLEFLGRVDRQIKVRGYRLEPGEVEAALAAHPEVREAAVAVRQEGAAARLVAWFVARRSAPDAAELRAWLRRKLPEPMVPALFVALPALPLTANGKIDRAALADPATAPLPAADRAVPRLAPRTPSEAEVATAWAEALGLDLAEVGAEDDFFTAGGHSLLAPRLTALLRRASGVELPLRTVFERPTVAGLAAALDELRPAPGAAFRQELPPIERRGRQAPPPLSLAQQRLWFLDRLEPGSPVNNLPLPLLLEGGLDPPALRRAFERLALRHEALRTTFPVVGGEPVQRVADPAPPLALPVADLAGLAPARREAEALRLARQEALRPFDLEKGPLLRVALLRLGRRRHALFLTLHHIVADGRSIGVLLRELAFFYGAFRRRGVPDAAAARLAELPVQYGDYAIWQRRWLHEQAAPLAASLSWWRERLAGAPAVLRLPVDRPRPAAQRFSGGSRWLEIGPEESAALRQLGRAQGASLFMVLLAVFTALLRRLTGQGDVVVGTAAAGRPLPELEGLIGFFVNNLVLRLDAAGDPRVGDLLAGVRVTALAAYSREVPFDKLVEELRPERDLSHNPFYQVAFALEGSGRPALALPGLALSPLKVGSGTAKFDLALYMDEGAGALTGLLEYSLDLFDAATAERLLKHFGVLAREVPRRLDRRLHDLPLLDEAERHQALREANDTAAPAPATPFVHHWIERRAAAAPAAPAVTGGGRTLSYGELNRRANQLAHRLLRLGAGAEARVAVAIARSPELVVAMLAIWKAGAAYVPLDPAYPAERLAAMLADCGAAVVLADAASAARLPAGAAPVVTLDESWSGLAAEPAGNPRPPLAPRNLVYVIYTSGSTGRPKGVMIEHASLASYAASASRIYGVTAADRVLQFCSISFDISIEEIVPCLTQGAELVLRTDAMLESVATFLATCRAWGLTLLSLPTAYWHEITARMESEGLALPPTLRLVIIAGERALPERLLEWRRGAPRQPRLVNTYGLTESTIISTAGDLTSCAADGRREVPIGRAIADTQLYVLDPALEPVPLGVPGELYIGGGLLARGYLGLPGATAERFVPNPFRRGAEPRGPGERLYRTGDLARVLPGGELEFLGRDDHQIKIRGYRIEIGEIEAALARHPGLAAVAVAAPEERPGQRRLAAYVVARHRPPELAELRAFLGETLPDYMVPARYLFLAALPMTPNGKLDRAALPPPGELTAAGLAAHEPPRDDTERFLAELWREALGVERVGIHDNFFDLGGQSLLLIRVHEAIKARFGEAVPMVDLFKQPTVAALARHLDRLEPAAVPVPAPPPAVAERAARTRAALHEGRFLAARRKLQLPAPPGRAEEP
jgi:amino acid adenylation domain-containing protein